MYYHTYYAKFSLFSFDCSAVIGAHNGATELLTVHLATMKVLSQEEIPLSNDSRKEAIKTDAKPYVFPTVFKYGGYEYTKHSQNAQGTVGYYDCRKKKCCAKLHLRRDPITGAITVIPRNQNHSCYPSVEVQDIFNIKNETKIYIEDNTNIFTLDSRPMMTIARAVHDHFQAKYEGSAIISHTIDQIYELIRDNRKSENGLDWEARVPNPPLSSTSDTDPRPFLIFNLTFYTTDPHGAKRKHRILCWAHPDLVFQLGHGGVHLFIDGTFDVVPKGFTQCLIVMAYLPGTGQYVPIFYALMDAKLQQCYEEVFHFIIKECGGRLRVLTVTAGTHTSICGGVRVRG